MVQRVSTVAFEGIEARAVDVQVQVAPGLPAFAVVGKINPGIFVGFGLRCHDLFRCFFPSNQS